MSTDRDVTRIVRSWLEEGVTALPDRVLDNVLDLVPATPQRRAWWPARRLNQVNTPIRIAVAAAAVLIVAVVGVNLLPRQGGFGGVGPSLTPTPSPSLLQAPGSLDPGSYYMEDPRNVTSGRLVFTVPATGWETIDVHILGKNLPGGSDFLDVAVSAWDVGNLKADACQWRQGGINPPVGSTVDDLATALVAQANSQPQHVDPAIGGGASATKVTIGGYAGKKVEFSIPGDFESSSCDEGTFARWQPASDPSDWGGFAYGGGQRNVVYIIDVAGTRRVIDTMYLPGASEADVAELDALVASIRFEQPTSKPSPSS